MVSAAYMVVACMAAAFVVAAYMAAAYTSDPVVERNSDPENILAEVPADTYLAEASAEDYLVDQDYNNLGPYLSSLYLRFSVYLYMWLSKPHSLSIYFLDKEINIKLGERYESSLFGRGRRESR